MKYSIKPEVINTFMNGKIAADAMYCDFSKEQIKDIVQQRYAQFGICTIYCTYSLRPIKYVQSLIDRLKKRDELE